MRYRFPLIDRQLAIRLDSDLSSAKTGEVVVVETSRRLIAEDYFSYIRALWWMWLADGRSILSVPPGAGKAISSLILGLNKPMGLYDPALAATLRVPIDDVLREAGLPETNQIFTDYCFACNADLLLRHSSGDCRRLVDESIPPAEGLWWPRPCITDGIVYGVIADQQVAAIAYAHRTAIMPFQVADIAVCTAEPYRRRGYARTAVSALVAHMAKTGGEARYTCDKDNAASIATVR